MFGLEKLFQKGKQELSAEDIAEMLRITPERLHAFENSYQDMLSRENEKAGVFNINSRQASKMSRNMPVEDGHIQELCRRITSELAAQTSVFLYDGNGRYIQGTDIPDQEKVTLDEVMSVPEGQRPQLTGRHYKRDMPEGASSMILYFYQKFLEEKEPVKKKMYYHTFRQGLDIQDLDPILYEMIGTNPNSMGKWLPQLVDACKNLEFFKIPKTVVAQVPLPILQLTRLDYASLTEATKRIVNDWAKEVFRLGGGSSNGYFIKTGTYSSKFDFRNAKVTDPNEINEIGEYLTFIQFQALQMAGPLCTPCIYGVSTTNEWVVRDFIPDKENNPMIYKGLPLHTEYRVFLDCDTDEILGITPYWEPETMKKRFSQEDDKDSPHQIHDYLIYLSHEPVLMKRYEENKEKVLEEVEKLLPWLDLNGQWSLDIMQNGTDFWLIDMARAESSAFYKECVPARLRRPVEEDWIPQLEKKEVFSE